MKNSLMEQVGYRLDTMAARISGNISDDGARDQSVGRVRGYITCLGDMRIIPLACVIRACALDPFSFRSPKKYCRAVLAVIADGYSAGPDTVDELQQLLNDCEVYRV